VIDLQGGDDFARLAKALREAGRKDLRNQLARGLRKGAKPLIPAAQEAAEKAFPKRGGLADVEAAKKFTVSIRNSAQAASVRITSPGRNVNLKLLNRSGRIRKPVFADKAKSRSEWIWKDQEIPGGLGWFDRAMNENAPKVRPELEAAVQRVIENIVKGAKR
jgi:hypothetical protein